uniref:Uncharacterized protein n=1 Tax=Anguilla anguilla TaxID=7936 RepID=A0A0E9PH97_ANGAN
MVSCKYFFRLFINFENNKSLNKYTVECEQRTYGEIWSLLLVSTNVAW